MSAPGTEQRDPRVIGAVVLTLCACALVPLVALVLAPWTGATEQQVIVYERASTAAFAAVLGLLGSTRAAPRNGGNGGA